MGAGPYIIETTCPACGRVVEFDTGLECSGEPDVFDAAPLYAVGALLGTSAACECGVVLTVEGERPRIAAREPEPGPCRFCGSTDVAAYMGRDSSPAGHFIRCEGCGAQGPRTTEALAVRYWNTGVPPKARPQEK
jgi:hypothetical protein